VCILGKLHLAREAVYESSSASFRRLNITTSQSLSGNGMLRIQSNDGGEAQKRQTENGLWVIAHLEEEVQKGWEG
jgi:uncharacterized protein YtpQ (UPF0354 family)